MSLPATLPMEGLEVGPSQVWGNIRLIPLLRRDCPSDLRLGLRRFAPHLLDLVVGLPHDHVYTAYLPHALIARWTEDGEPAALAQTAMAVPRVRGPRLQVHHRMRLREDTRTLRMLPLGSALAGFMAHGFAGPDIVWSGWTPKARRRGLAPRHERALGGWGVPLLADALRLFEIHADQVGVILCVGDRCVSASVYAHPDDYRALHRSLLENFFCEELLGWGLHPGELPRLESPLEGPITDLAGLAARVDAQRSLLARTAADLARTVFEEPVRLTPSYTAGPFRLFRSASASDDPIERHIGELILRPDGTLGYLRTYRLTREQISRFDLLSALAAAEWHPERTASNLGLTLAELVQKLDRLGLSGLLTEHAPKNR